MKAIKTHLQEHNPERVEAFEKGAQAFAKKIVGDIKNYQFVSSCVAEFSTRDLTSCAVYGREHEPGWNGGVVELQGEESITLT